MLSGCFVKHAVFEPNLVQEHGVRKTKHQTYTAAHQKNCLAKEAVTHHPGTAGCQAQPRTKGCKATTGNHSVKQRRLTTMMPPATSAHPEKPKNPHARFGHTHVRTKSIAVNHSVDVHLPRKMLTLRSWQQTCEGFSGRNVLLSRSFLRFSCSLSLSNLPPYVFLCLFVCLSVLLSVCLSVYLSVCLTVCPSICLSVCPSVCLSDVDIAARRPTPTQ